MPEIDAVVIQPPMLKTTRYTSFKTERKQEKTLFHSLLVECGVLKSEKFGAAVEIAEQIQAATKSFQTLLVAVQL